MATSTFLRPGIPLKSRGQRSHRHFPAPAEAVEVKAKSTTGNTRTAKPTKLRTSITPGTVLILLAGRFRGKRVVFLKQLEGGLLLVTGPFRVNGVPLKRVAQSYVLATSTKIDISGAQLPEELSDDLFKGPRKTIKQLSEQKFFGDKVEKAPLPESFIALQKQVDQAIIAEVSKTPLMTNYLKNTFTLKKGQAPHLMKF